MRDYDGHVYIREWGNSILLGGFEPWAKPAFKGGIPERFEFQLLPEDWDQFRTYNRTSFTLCPILLALCIFWLLFSEIILEQGLHRVPDLQHIGVKKFINGPESFTPDGRIIFGEAAEVLHLAILSII